MAQQSWLDVANNALVFVGANTVVSLTQALTEARLCKQRLPGLVGVVLRSYPWKSAMKAVNLAALTNPPTDTQWAYAYQYPSDIARVWAFNQGTPLSGINYGINYVIRSGQVWSNSGTAQDGTGAPLLTYVANSYSTGPGNLDALLLEAISRQLAADMCYQLTQSLSLKQELQKDANLAMKKARSVDSMESPEIFDIEASEFLTARFTGTGWMGPNSPGFPNAP